MRGGGLVGILFTILKYIFLIFIFVMALIFILICSVILFAIYGIYILFNDVLLGVNYIITGINSIIAPMYMISMLCVNGMIDIVNIMINACNETAHFFETFPVKIGQSIKEKFEELFQTISDFFKQIPNKIADAAKHAAEEAVNGFKRAFKL